MFGRLSTFKSLLPRNASSLSLCLALGVLVPACDVDGESDSAASTAKAITGKEVLDAQKVWGDGIVAIGRAFTEKGDYKQVAANHVDTLYAYGISEVLFKPTKAAAQQFRLDRDQALSYFVGGVVAEDKGFALQPWTAVRFENASMIVKDDHAIAMGNYFFTDGTTGQEVKVEFTFGYMRNEAGNLVINVHHSALPYVAPQQ